jgi:nitrate reductase cytochrome c-type subunit
MNALREMGYVAVGIGQTEIKADLISLLAGYALQKEQRPFTLAGNAEGKTLGKQYFPVPPGAKRPIVDQIEVVRLGRIPVGVAGVVGPGLQQENAKNKWDDALDFTNTNAAIAGALKALDNHADKPSLKILIFQGPSGDAAKVAAAFPEFQAILCQSDSDLPPLQPQSIPQKGGAATLVIQVGHRGQHVGVLGAFKKPEGGGFDLKYQLVPMGEEYITPGATESEALSANKALQALDEYARNVKSANLLPEYPRTPHPAQIHAQSLKPAVALKYVGTDACQACHAAEFNKWKTASHSHAMETLEKVAKRPSLRNFDGECVKCHTVGFDYHSGYIDDKKSAHLRNVGCESCHGPGSGHVAAPKNKDFLGYMMPWKQQNALKLPDGKFMKMMAEKAPSDRGSVAIAPAQQILLRQVENMCLKCHDHEADPHFDLFKNWQKIDHTGLAPPGGWPVVPPK